MYTDHPNRQRFVASALGSLLLIVGCQGSPSAMTNPFMQSNRVPPPSTRTVAPGTAQPYYPGDPLPSMQSATPPAASPAAPANNLGATGAATTAAATVASTTGNEPAPRIPLDNDDLRFALPSPPTAAAPQAAPGAANPAATSSVVPANYLAGATSPTPAADPAIAADGPWRSPRIPSAAAAPQPFANPPPIAAQPNAQAGFQPAWAQTAAQQPIAATVPAGASTMPVELRAVPPPRIRFADPATQGAQPGVVPNASPAYVATTGEIAPNVPATAVPQPSFAPTAAPGFTTPATSTRPDGFRHRGSRW